MQELNYQNMSIEKAVMIIQVGLEDLEVAVLVADWQYRNNRYFPLEQPTVPGHGKKNALRDFVNDQEYSDFDATCAPTDSTWMGKDQI